MVVENAHDPAQEALAEGVIIILPVGGDEIIEVKPERRPACFS